MNLETLRSVQVDERGTTDLQPLPDSFYQDVAGYLEELREQRDRAAERAEDPFGSETVRRLTDEIETAEEVIEAIYERRMGKVVNRASLAAAGMSADEAGLTAEETELFRDLVAVIEDHRADVLSVLERAELFDRPESIPTDESHDDHSVPTERGSDGPPSTGDPDDTDTAVTDQSPERPSAAPEESSVASSDSSEPRVTVRILRDVGEIFGVDERTYHLTTDDVVTLPKANAEPLLERDAAERIHHQK